MENLAYILAAVALLFEGKKTLKRLAVLTWYNQFQRMEFEALRAKEYSEQWQPLACQNYTALQKAKAHFAKYGNVDVPLFIGSPVDSFQYLERWELETNEKAPNYIVLRFGLSEWQRLKSKAKK
jgi:hypothetical protein